MGDNLKIIIGLLIYLIMPVILALIVVKLFLNGKGTVLFIILIALIILEIIAAIFKLVKYKK